MNVLIPYRKDKNRSLLLAYRLQDFDEKTASLSKIYHDVVIHFKNSITFLYSKYSCALISVSIEFPYSETFNTPPGSKGRIVAVLTHWCESLGMTSLCYKDLVVARKGNIDDGPLLLTVANIRDSPETQQGGVTITFAQRKVEIDDKNDGQLGKPIDAIDNMMKLLDNTYPGLPIKLWSICKLCGKELVLWNDRKAPLLNGEIKCYSCLKRSTPPDFSQWPRYWEFSLSLFFLLLLNRGSQKHEFFFWWHWFRLVCRVLTGIDFIFSRLMNVWHGIRLNVYIILSSFKILEL